MKWFGVALGASFVAAVLAALLGTTAAHAQPMHPVSFAERLLVAHNQERDRVGVPRLRWSAKLAGQAQAWADELARTNRFQHSESRDGAGENLWMGAAGYYSAEKMISGFTDEVRFFHAGAFPDVSNSGSWHDVGHYTQLIWRDTQEVGCAVARGQRNDILVCRYFPAGNVIGRPVL